MSNTSVTTGGTPPLSLPARFLGIITSPKETFASVVAHPRWLGVLVLTTVIIAIGTALPMTTEAGKEATLRSSVEVTEALGMQVSDQMYEQMRGRMWFAPYQTAISVLIFSPIMAVAISGVLFLVFNVVMGGTATFKQMFAVFVHAGVISSLQQLFTGPLNYFRGSVSSATNLAVLLPMIEAKSFLGRLLAGTDLFMIWRLLVLAIGLAVLYRRRTQPIAITLLGIYAVIVLGFAAIMSSFS